MSPDVEVKLAWDEEREVTISPMLFDKWRVHIGPIGSLTYDDGW